MNPALEHKVQQMLAQDLILAESNMITPGSPGVYDVFGRWTLRDQQHQVEISTRDRLVGRFGNLRSALSWCIAEKYHQHELAHNIRNLDHDLQRFHAARDAYRQILARITDPQRRWVISIKGEEATLRYRQAAERMSIYVSRAKYLQIRGFNDEIARTRRPAPYRTSRDGVRKSIRKKV
jgi:hypothetical protein